MTIRNTFMFGILSLVTAAASGQVEINDTQRYIDANTFVLNEPCVEFNGVQFKGQFLLEQSPSALTWKILSGEQLAEPSPDCSLVQLGDAPNEVKYDLSRLIVADGNSDTGQRFDVNSIADATRLDLGFNIVKVDASAAPSLVVASNLELPLHFTNEKFGEGLDVCLSAVGTDSITISNANNSFDLTFSEETEPGTKKFCGNIPQDKLEFGDVFYNAKMGRVEVDNAVTYWNPQCIGGNICGQNPPIMEFPQNLRVNLSIVPQGTTEIYQAYVSVVPNNSEEVANFMLFWDGEKYQSANNEETGYTSKLGSFSFRSYFVRNGVNGAAKISLQLGERMIVVK